MARHKRIRLAAAVAAGAVTLASLPTAGLALGGLPEAEGRGAFAALTPASADPELAAFLARKGGTKAQLIRFTPAGAAERTDRSVTVAVRIDEQAAQAISVRSSIEAVLDQVAGESRLRIAPTRYNLGLSRGYQSFARPTVPTISRDLSDEVPDLAQIRTAPGAKEETPSRFAARIDSEAPRAGTAAPRITPDQTVDLEGSYRLTRNLNVTAGVRYSQDRDRLVPLGDSAKQDNQAVYIGTRFQF
jgi:hypothetical protein